MSVLLIYNDQRQGWLGEVRTAMTSGIEIIHKMSYDAQNIYTTNYAKLQNKDQLIHQNLQLQEQMTLLKGRIRQLEALDTENKQLRTMLNANVHINNDLRLVSILGKCRKQMTRCITIDKGKTHGVYRGQVIIIAEGVIGQIAETNKTTSEVILITDPQHSIPVMVKRSGVHLTLDGTGDERKLIAQHIKATSDIRTGDELVTSGLGHRFPAGYRVGEVSEIHHHKDSDTFISISADTSAQIQTHYALLIIHPDYNHEHSEQP